MAPLPAGHGVRGWLVVGKPMSGERGLTDERLRLLEGLSYRVAMALEKARLARHREQSLHVANALLMFARSLARAEKGDVEECIVRLAAEMLEAREVSLWLQAAPGAEVAAVAAWDDDEEHRALVLGDHASRPSRHSRSRSGPSRSCFTLRSTPRFPELQSSAVGAASR